MKLELSLNQRIYPLTKSNKRFTDSAIKELRSQYNPVNKGMLMGRVVIVTDFFVPGTLFIHANEFHLTIINLLHEAGIIQGDRYVSMGVYSVNTSLDQKWMTKIKIETEAEDVI